MHKIELMSPVGSYESLTAAIQAKADSVYFGVAQLNMRARSADNFTLKDLKKIAGICKKNGIKSYLTLNTVVYDSEFGLIKKICSDCKRLGCDSVCAQNQTASSSVDAMQRLKH
jgi:putative protease